jgi:hypothetical protein
MSKENPKSDTLAEERAAFQAKQTKAGCCGGAAPEGADACCALDAETKAAGGSGCGCNRKAAGGTSKSGGCC